jgi:hypothetical protein
MQSLININLDDQSVLIGSIQYLIQMKSFSDLGDKM